MSPKDKSLIHCSFCGKSQDQVQKLIAGPGIFICDECVLMCNQILNEEGINISSVEEEVNDFNLVDIKDIPLPKDIKSHLDSYVIGCDDAKKTLSVAVYNHYKRVFYNKSHKDDNEDINIQKSNILLLGPTGSGKTHVVETLAKFLNVPFAIADATSITEAGYVGEDAENILQRLYQNAEEDVEKAEIGIIYIDEIDKISRKSENPSITRDVSGEGVQQALLKMIEGTSASISATGGRKHPQMQMIDISTHNILFICGGAFVGLEQVIEKRRSKSNSQVGFGAAPNTEENRTKRLNEAFKYTQTEDLVNFGLIPEFVGRVPVITSLDAPDVESLKRILVEPKSSLIKQYKKLFELDEIEIDFEDAAIEKIAAKAHKRKMGARALRSVTESIMKDIMYEAPSDDEMKHITITADMIDKVDFEFEEKIVPIDSAKKKSNKQAS